MGINMSGDVVIRDSNVVVNQAGSSSFQDGTSLYQEGYSSYPNSLYGYPPLPMRHSYYGSVYNGGYGCSPSMRQSYYGGSAFEYLPSMRHSYYGSVYNGGYGCPTPMPFSCYGGQDRTTEKINLVATGYNLTQRVFGKGDSSDMPLIPTIGGGCLPTSCYGRTETFYNGGFLAPQSSYSQSEVFYNGGYGCSSPLGFLGGHHHGHHEEKEAFKALKFGALVGVAAEVLRQRNYQ